MAKRPEKTSGNQDVIDAAYARKDGGQIPIKKKKGGAVMDKDCKADGGKVVAKLKEGGKIEGRASGGRLDKFARGGRTGSDKNPFSSAKLD